MSSSSSSLRARLYFSSASGESYVSNPCPLVPDLEEIDAISTAPIALSYLIVLPISSGGIYGLIPSGAMNCWSLLAWRSCSPLCIRSRAVSPGFSPLNWSIVKATLCSGTMSSSETGLPSLSRYKLGFLVLIWIGKCSCGSWDCNFSILSLLFGYAAASASSSKYCWRVFCSASYFASGVSVVPSFFINLSFIALNCSKLGTWPSFS